MATNDDVHSDLYGKLNDTNENLAALSAHVGVLTNQNAELITLLRRALTYMFVTIIVLIGALIYGAIGKEGLYAVRDFKNISAHAMPIAPPPDNRFCVS